VGTGAVWQEENDGEWSRASFPLSLIDRYMGHVRNCMVVDNEGHIHLHYYTFCVLLQLKDALRHRSVFVKGSERWGDIRNKLLPEAAWRQVKTQACRSLDHVMTQSC